MIAFATTWDLMSQAQTDFLVKMAKHDGDAVHYVLVALQESKDRELVEVGPTQEIFTNPSDKRTEDYITGRFG